MGLISGPSELGGERHDLVLVGAGGFGREAAEVARSAAAADGDWTLRGFLDDGPSQQGGCVGGAPVLGPIERAHDLQDVLLVVCTGNPTDFDSRRRIIERLGLPAARYGTLVHPTAVVPPSVRIGEGCVLQAGVVATADVQIGRHVLVMPQVVFTHDDMVGDFVTIGAGALLAGGVHVGDGAYIGAGSCVREGLTIGAGALLGMGSVAVTDIPPGEVWCGNPARHLRDVAPSDSAPLVTGGASEGNQP